MPYNAYDTEDPEKLLALKRQESDALLDIIRVMNKGVNENQLIKVAFNLLRAQLGIGKLAFYRKKEAFWHLIEKTGYTNLPETVPYANDLNKGPVKGGKLTESIDKSEMAYLIPLQNRDLTEGFFIIDEFADSEAEVLNDIIFIETVGQMVILAIENNRLTQEKISQEMIRKELETAEKIQQHLMKVDVRFHSEVDAFAKYIAHSKVGGDYYDLIPITEHVFYLCIADVSGKGVSSALLMANLQASLRALIRTQDNLERNLRELNELIRISTGGEKFITVFLARIDMNGKEIQYINAGHNPPMIIKAGTIEELTEGSIPLGIMELQAISIGKISFAIGDSLFLYTDGLPEQENLQGVFYGTDRIVKLLSDHILLSAEDHLHLILEDFWRFSENSQRRDDVSLMMLKFK